MMLFKWRSIAFGDFSAGSIVVMAGSVSEAREMATRELAKGRVKDAVIYDLGKDPEIVDSGVIKFVGSA